MDKRKDPLSFLDEDSSIPGNISPSNSNDPLDFLDSPDFSDTYLKNVTDNSGPPPAPPKNAPGIVTPDNEQGWLSATGTAIARGAMGIPEMGAGAIAGIDRLFDRYINAEPENDPDNWDLKEWAHGLKSGIESKKNKMFKPATKGAKGTWASGVESVVTSAGIKVPIAVASIMSLPFTMGASAILGLVATAPAFGLSQYDEAVGRYTKGFIKEGYSPEKARNMAEVPSLLEGSFEVISEVISDIIEGKIAAPGISVAKEKMAESTLRMMLKEGLWKASAKKVPEIFVAETAGEWLNSIAQGVTQEKFGKNKDISDVLNDPKFWDNMTDQLGQIMVASLIFGAIGAGGHIAMNSTIANNLENPVAKKDKRMEAADVVANDIARESKTLAKVWRKSAQVAIDKNEGISLDKPIDEFGVEDPASTSGRIARALVGEPPLSPTGEPTAPDLAEPTNEEIDAVINDAANTEERLAGLENILSDKGIDTDFIRNKVDELGSVDAVDKFYADDVVGEFARLHAESVFGKKTETPELTHKPFDNLWDKKMPELVDLWGKMADHSDEVGAKDKAGGEALGGEYEKAFIKMHDQFISEAGDKAVEAGIPEERKQEFEDKLRRETSGEKSSLERHGDKTLNDIYEETLSAFKTRGIGDRRSSSVDVENDRRSGTGDRRDLSKVRTDDMTEEEMRRALNTDSLTLIPNDRAYGESEKKPLKVSIDADSLKWFNDNMGQIEGGDEMLKRIAKALHDETGDAYRFHGDEFVMQGNTTEELEAALNRAREVLANEEISVRKPNGTVVTKKGIDITYGIAEDLKAADAKMKQEKLRREQEGKRAARGEQPAGVTITEGKEGHAQSVEEIRSGKTTETPEEFKGQTASDGTPLWDSIENLKEAMFENRKAVKEETDLSRKEGLERAYETMLARHDYMIENGEPNQKGTAAEDTTKQEGTDVKETTKEEPTAGSEEKTGTEGESKSKGHIAFKDGYEYYRDAKGDVYRAQTSSVIDLDTGYRIGRFEAPSSLADQYLEQVGIVEEFKLGERGKASNEKIIQDIREGNTAEMPDSLAKDIVIDEGEDANQVLSSFWNSPDDLRGLADDYKVDMGVAASGDKANISHLVDMLEARIDYLENAVPPGTGKTTAPTADNLQDLSDDDLNALFDQAAEEVSGEQPTAETPTTTGEKPGKTPSGATEASNEGQTTSQGGGMSQGGATVAAGTEKTAGEAFDDFVSHAGAGVKHAAAAIEEIFKGLAGDGNTLKSGIGFDDETYQKLKPHLKAIADEWLAAGKAIEDFFKALIRKFGVGIKPYAVQFLKDKRDDNLDTGEKPVSDEEKANEGKADTSKEKAGKKKKKKKERNKRYEDAGEHITGMRKDAEDALIQRKEVADRDNPVRTIKKRTSGILNNISFNKESSFGVARFSKSVNSMIMGFTEFAGKSFGGRRGKYSAMTFNEAIERKYMEDPDAVIAKANEYIESLKVLKSMFERALTLDDVFNDLFDLFIDLDALNNDELDIYSYLNAKQLMEALENGEYVNIARNQAGKNFEYDLARESVSYNAIKNIFKEIVKSKETEFEDEKNKEILRETRRIETIETDGKHRDNKDVTPDDIISTFGIRGIGLGSWTEGTHQQASLNLTYDSFFAMAKILGISEESIKGISLPGSDGKGQLGITYGAHARGGRHAAAYYPNDRAIGLTKKKGDGALAHEWAHAFDFLIHTPGVQEALADFKSQLRHFYDLTDAEAIIERYVRNAASKLMSQEGATMLSIRKMMRDSFDNNFHKETTYFVDAKNIEGGSTGICGQKQPGDQYYWANDEELFARAFEAWISDKLTENEEAAEYLVQRSFVREGGMGALFNQESEAYPKGDFRQKVSEMFDYLFENISWDKDGIPTLDIDNYELLGEKNRKEAEETLERLLDKGEELFNSIYSAEKSEDGLYWYAYMNTARGENMQPQGFFAYDDKYALPDGHEYKGHGEGAVAYPERLSIEQTRDKGLTPTTHNEAGDKVYLKEANNDADWKDSGPMGGDQTEDGGVPPGEGDTGEGPGTGGRGNGPTTGGSGGIDTGGEQGNGAQGGEGNSVSTDVSVSDGEGNADTTAGDMPIPAAGPLDYELTAGDEAGGRSLARRLADNLSAIKLLNKIESENRLATAEEQKELVKYSGWGGLGEAFSPNPSDGWAVQAKTVKDALSAEEFENANGEIVNAYYTPQKLVSSMYSVLEHLGFTGGRILEPAVGTGNFFGAMPTTMRSNSTLVGIERSSVSSRIAKQLYQSASIHNSKFQQAPLIAGSFDVAISNVPFDMNFVPTDSEHNKERLPLQRYFLKKSLDMVRPGGIVAMISSTGALDRTGDTFFSTMNLNGEMLGAFRLPAGTFSDTGTQVVTDVIFVRKKGNNLPEANASEFSQHTGTYFPFDESSEDREWYNQWNRYFKENPDHVLGTVIEAEIGRYGGMKLSVSGDSNAAIDKLVDVARKDMTPGVYQEQNKTEAINPLENLSKPGEVKSGGMYEKNGKIYLNGVELKFKNETAAERITSMLGVRDIARKLIRNAYGDAQYGDNESLRKELNEFYDSFVKKHGHINGDENKRLIMDDPDGPLLLSLEKWDSVDKKFLGKSDIFTKELSMAVTPPASADTVEEAMGHSLSYKGKVDLGYISSLTGLGKDEIIAKLGDLIYDDPARGWVSAEEYLSGHISRKLKDARQVAKGNKRFERNVTALEKHLPEPIKYKDIHAGLGAPWIAPEHISSFIDELSWDLSGATISYTPEIGKWSIDWNGWSSRDVTARKRTYAASTEFGAVRAITDVNGKQHRIGKNFFDLLGYALNGGTPKVKSTLVSDEMNQELTEAALQRLEMINQRFSQWIFSDPERAAELESTYNEIFTGFKRRKYDGSHLPFIGKIPDSIVKLRKHQVDAVWRFITDGTAYLGHEVGTGKTYTMAASIMESKRLGLMKKPLLVTTLQTQQQIATEFIDLYPGANILKINFTDKSPLEKKTMMQQIATGNWDAVMVTHDQLKKIPISAQSQQRIINEELASYRAALNSTSSRTAQRIIQSKIDKLEEKLQETMELQDSSLPTMESIGIDGIVVDEAHKFKNLSFPTAYTGVKGLGGKSSGRADDLYMKVNVIEHQNGRNVLFASGTPVSNSISEMYLIQKYLQPELLKERNINSFDMWIKTFGLISSESEPAPEGGGFNMVEKITGFRNLPELLSTVSSVLDMVRTKDTGIRTPKVRGGKAEQVVVESNPYVDAYREILIQRAMQIKAMGKDAIYGGIMDLALRLVSGGRVVAMDHRLLNPALPDHPNTKTNYAVKNIIDIYNSTHKTVDEEGNLTGKNEENAVQFVFADLGVPHKGKFSVYNDIKQKLIDGGIPEKEIVFAQDYARDKAALSAEARKGSVRVVVGSTDVLGIGINAQTKLAAIHNLDMRWNYADYEQRLGRMIRQGNTLDEVRVLDYGMQNSADTFMWSKVYDKKTVMDKILYSGDLTTRVFDDNSDDTITAGEMLTALANDPEHEESIKVRNKIRKLTNLMAEWQYNKAQAEEDAKKLPQEIETAKRDEKEFGEAVELLNKGTAVALTQRRDDTSAEKVIPLDSGAKELKKELDDVLKGLDVTGDLKIFGAVVEHTMETIDVPVLDKNGKAVVDPKLEKAGILAPANIKTKSKKVAVRGRAVGHIYIKTLAPDSLFSSPRTIIEISLRKRKTIVNDISQEKGADTPTIGRTLASGKKRFKSLAEKAPDKIKRLEKRLEDIKPLLAETEFPQLEELNAAVARNEELSDILVEKLRLQEEERRNNPIIAEAEKYFPEPTPPDDSAAAGGIPDSDVLVFSRRQSAAPTGAITRKMAVAAARESVKRLKLDNAPPIIVVQSENELPPHALAAIIDDGAQDEVTAFYDKQDGNVYIIADNNANISEVHEAVLHEITGHFGLRGVLGDQLIPVLQQVAEFYGVDGLSDVAERYKLDLSKRKDLLRAAEEKLAFTQQERGGTLKEVGFINRIFAKIRSMLRKAGFVNAMTNNDINKLLSDASAFARKKSAIGAVIASRSGGMLYSLRKKDKKSSSTKGKSLFPEVQKRLDKAQGIERKTTSSKMSEFLEKLKHSARHFPLLDPKKYGNLTNYLRVFEEAPKFSKYVAQEEIKKFIKDMGTEDYDVFRMHIILSDLMSDVNKGMYDEVLEAGKPLPFGYRNKEELQQDVDNINKQVGGSEKVSTAVKARTKFMNGLRNDLVDAGLLPKSVLNDDQYFHHQVIEYINMKQGTGTTSKDIRLKKKGFQKGRSGYTGDYNTEYVEAEFEVVSQAISQLETKKVMDRISRDYNEVSSLKDQAREENINRVYAALGYDPDNPTNQPMDEPFFPFRAKMAWSFQKLGKMAAAGELGDETGQYHEIVQSLEEIQLAKEQMEGMDDIPRTIVDHPAMFQFLSYLVNKGGPGALEAATIFRMIRNRKAFISSVLGEKEVKWEDLIDKNTHKIWKPKPFTAWYMTNSINDKVIARVIDGQQYLEQEHVRKVLARGSDVEWVLPIEIADTLDNFRDYKDEGVLSAASQKILNMWKQWVLINPLRFFKYNMNNMSGDLDFTFAYEPKIIKSYFVPAMKDLIAHYRNKKLSPELEAELKDAMHQGVLNTGLTITEIPDLTKAMEVEKYIKAILPKDNNRGLGVAKRGAQGAWMFLKDFTNLRENILRLAAYRYFKDNADKTGALGVTERAKAGQVTDPHEKAAMLSRDLLGDYGNLSQTSEWLRRQLIPFWSWQAINAPRYFRLFQNLMHDELQTGKKGTIRGAGVVGWKVGKTSMKVALLYSMISLWNSILFPEEEEALGEAGRRQLHLILWRRSDGSIISMKLQGALSDALGWFSLEDLPSDIRDVTSGKETVGTKLKEAAQAPFARIYQGSRPLLKSGVEAGIGLSTYPKFLAPRPVRDRIEHILRTFSMDKAWNQLAGKPIAEGSHLAQLAKDLSSIFFYSTDVDVTNYYDIRKKVFDFREKKLGTPPQTVIPSNKSNALYYYKQALRVGDVPAAEKYLEKYFDLGGTHKGINISVKMIHPLGGLPKRFRAQFLHSLSGKDKDAYHRALKWYTETYLKRSPESAGIVGRAWRASHQK